MARSIILVLWSFFMVTQPLLAQDQSDKMKNNLKSYFSEAAAKAKKSQDPAQKREILNRSFEKVFRALDTVEKLPVAHENQGFITALRNGTREKYDELNGLHGFVRVSDHELNNFADYVVQDLEQAENVTIITTTTTLIIIALIIILLAG